MRLSAVLIPVLLGTGLVSAQAPSLAPSGSPTPQGTAPSGKRASVAHPGAKLVQPAPAPVPPPAPPPPNWPINDRPNHASITWDSQGLRIQAANSSLQQILNDVSAATGAKVEGMGADQRVYGEYGPGQAKDVLSQLLMGSGYNVLLAGDLGQGAPREILLSPRRTAGNAPGSANRQDQNGDDDASDNEVEEQPQPLPQPPPTPIRPGFSPSGPPRGPQQIMEEMQQRQLQQQQQIQQQQQANPTMTPQN
jgi:hypothetical protein